MKVRNMVVVGFMVVILALSIDAVAGKRGGGKGGGQAATLTTEEIEGLLFMREEEKLARDVYTVMFETWGLRVFENIMASEQKHMDAVLGLLDKYNLPDPALGPGEFENEGLQNLYDELVTQGQQSVLGAIDAGIIIEVTDIDDITALLLQTDNSDITRVYTNLLEGSRNHLAAFESLL